MEHICEKCRLYNPHTSTCAIRIVNGTEVLRDLPVEPQDWCIWEQYGLDEFIQEVRFWVEDPESGAKTDGNGVVKIQYPKGFFGEEPNNQL